MTHSPWLNWPLWHHCVWHWPQRVYAAWLTSMQADSGPMVPRNSNPKLFFWKIMKVLLASRRYWCSKDHAGWLFFWFIVYNNQDNNLNQQNKNYISKSIRKLDELRKGLCSENFNQYSIVFSRLYSQNEKKTIFR